VDPIKDHTMVLHTTHPTTTPKLQMLNTGAHKLDSSANDFERGHVDVFVLKTKDVGEMKRVMVGGGLGEVCCGVGGGSAAYLLPGLSGSFPSPCNISFINNQREGGVCSPVW